MTAAAPASTKGAPLFGGEIACPAQRALVVGEGADAGEDDVRLPGLPDGQLHRGFPQQVGLHEGAVHIDRRVDIIKGAVQLLCQCQRQLQPVQMGIACAETADGLDHIYIKGMLLLGQGVAELSQHPAPGQSDGHAALQQREKELARRLGAPAQGGGAVGAGLTLDDHRVLQPSSRRRRSESS